MSDLRRALALLAGIIFLALALATTTNWIVLNPEWTMAEAYREMWVHYTAAFASFAAFMLLWER